jgi:hypothetical protein
MGGHVAHMEQMKNAETILVGKREGKRSFGRVVLKLILKKQDIRMQTGFIWIRTGTSSGSCEYANETSGSIKCVEYIDQINDY